MKGSYTMRVKELKRFIYRNHLPTKVRLRFLGDDDSIILKDVPAWMERNYSSSFKNFSLKNIDTDYEYYELEFADFINLFTEGTTSIPFDCCVFVPTYDSDGIPYYLLFDSSIDKDSLDYDVACLAIERGLSYGNTRVLKQNK